ncbi:hypothetical protein R1flu_026049 [Riccia fluitans]|uniref:Uncharacterized protein n=1 Tax=Riccia fluitans TaxID=41844 RepID=A0ABD1XEV6_9MARC
MEKPGGNHHAQHGRGGRRHNRDQQSAAQTPVVDRTGLPQTETRTPAKDKSTTNGSITMKIERVQRVGRNGLRTWPIEWQLETYKARADANVEGEPMTIISKTRGQGGWKLKRRKCQVRMNEYRNEEEGQMMW